MKKTEQTVVDSYHNQNQQDPFQRIIERIKVFTRQWRTYNIAPNSNEKFKLMLEASESIGFAFGIEIKDSEWNFYLITKNESKTGCKKISTRERNEMQLLKKEILKINKDFNSIENLDINVTAGLKHIAA